MAVVTLYPSDLAPFAEIDPVKAEAMIDDALALAARVAPCILDPAFEFEAAARAILRGAVLRWHDAGTGALQSSQAGPFGVQFDTGQQRRSMFWPSDIEALEGLCRSSGQGRRAFAVDLSPADAGTWAY